MQPDAVLFYGDTNSCLAAIAAKRRRIPIFHLEAGNRCFDQRVPEEINRKIIDHISDINMPLTEQARGYLLAEGLRPETVIKIGSTMREVLEYYRPGIARVGRARPAGTRSRSGISSSAPIARKTSTTRRGSSGSSRRSTCSRAGHDRRGL